MFPAGPRHCVDAQGLMYFTFTSVPFLDHGVKAALWTINKPHEFSIQRLKKTCHVKKEQGILELGSECLLTQNAFQLLGWPADLVKAALYLHCWTHKGKVWELGGDN